MVKVKSSLVDTAGRPLEFDLLGREISAPTLGGVRSVLSNHPAQGMDPSRLANILRAAESGDTDAYFDLAEEVEEKYLHYQGNLSSRKNAVAQLPITVNAAGDDDRSQRDAELLRKLYKRPAIKRAIKDILDAIGKGFSVHEIVWNPKARPWLPVKLVYRKPQWFELDRVDLETLRLKGGPDNTGGVATDLPPYKFLVHRHKAKSGLTIRGGLARGVSWAWLFQNFSIKDWVIFCEVYGLPMRLGKYDASATEEDRRTLMRAVVGIGTDAAGIIPKSMDIEFVNAMASGNAEVFHALCVYLDQQVSKAVLGQTGTTDATTGGFGSSGAVHNDVRKDIQQADAEQLGDTLTELGQWVIDLNHGPPPSGEYPEVNVGEEEFFSKEDLEKVREAVDMGVEIEASWLRDRIGAPDPDKRTSDGQPVKLLKARGSPAAAPVDPAGATQIPEGPPTPPLKPLNAIKRPLDPSAPVAAAALEGDLPNPDAIDDLIAEIEDEWKAIAAPPIDVLQAASFDDFKAGLAARLNDDPAALDLVARTLFAARLAGEAGTDISGGSRGSR